MNTTQELCSKSMTIYHIVDKKVGSTSNIKKRLSNQGGYNQISWEVLHEIEPNTMTYREVWEFECSEQVRLGYEVENEGHYQTFLRNHTNNSQQGKPLTVAQKKAQSVAMSGENHPMFGKAGRSGENSAMFGKTGKNHPKTKAYNILALDGSLFAYTDDPTGFEKEHRLAKSALTNCANPKNNQRHIKINDIKYTVSYA